MRSPQQPLYAIFGVAFLLAGCDQGAGSRADAASQGDAAASQGAAASKKCQKWLRVSEDNDPHLELQERFRISGPTPDGDYRLRPVGGGHQVLSKDHLLVQSSPSGDEFEGEIEIQAQGGFHGQQVSLHFYHVVMDLDGNGCPSKLTLETDVHPADPGFPDHGGDAVMD